MVQSGAGIKLFQFQQNAAGGSWDLASASADTNFYDINEDSAGKKKEWHIEIGSDVDLLVTDQLHSAYLSRNTTVASLRTLMDSKMMPKIEIR